MGLGNMGLPMAARLREAGYTVQAFDLSPAAQASAEEAGMIASANVVDAVSAADAVILMLPSTAMVRTVLEDEAVLAALAPGVLVIDMGSSEPLATRQLAEMLTGRGLRFMDAPVSGGVTAAQAGTLTIMAGARPEDFAKAQPLISILGKPVHVGAVGAGDAVKALNNLLSATHLWVTSEAVLAGERFGIDPEILLGVVNSSSGRSGSSEVKWPRFVLPGSFDSGFTLRLMLKDMKIATDLCEQVGQAVTLGAEAVTVWEKAAAGLPESADHTEVARWLRDADTDHS